LEHWSAEWGGVSVGEGKGGGGVRAGNLEEKKVREGTLTATGGTKADKKVEYKPASKSRKQKINGGPRRERKLSET